MNILYIKRAYNTRLHNQVTGLAQRGHKITVLLEASIEAGYNGPAQWDKKDVQSGVILIYTGMSAFSRRLRNYRNKLISSRGRTNHGEQRVFLRTLKKIFKTYPVDLIISSNDAIETEDHRSKWVIEEWKGKVPIIYECQDILSDCFAGVSEIEETERYVNEMADGVIHTNSRALEWISNKYRINKSFAFPNYACARYFQDRLPKLSENDGSIHLVYCGSVQRTPKNYSYPFARDMKHMFREIASLGYPLHLHLGLYPGTANYEYYRELRNIANIVLHDYLPFDEMMKTLSRYDVGMFPVDLGSLKKHVELFGPDYLDDFPLSRADTSKQYEYTMAGLPVLTTPLKWISDWLKKNNFGTCFHSVSHLGEILGGSRMHDYRFSVEKAATRFSMENRIEELERFLWDVIR